jgi:hypothetical protein
LCFHLGTKQFRQHKWDSNNSGNNQASEEAFSTLSTQHRTKAFKVSWSHRLFVPLLSLHVPMKRGKA